MTVQQEATQGIVLTDGASAKVSSLLAQEGRDDLRLRIAVQPGGCSGLRYQLYFDERDIDGDIVADFGGVQVVTDKMSARNTRESLMVVASQHDVIAVWPGRWRSKYLGTPCNA